MTTFLFPSPEHSKGYSIFLLAFRIFFGLMLMMHGLDKLANYVELTFTFPDPMGIGRELSLALAIFGELCCSIAFIIGFLYRIFLIPMLVVMGTAFFYTHGGSIANGELAFVYFIALVMMYIAGPGRYSVDAAIYRRIHKEEDTYEF